MLRALYTAIALLAVAGCHRAQVNPVEGPIRPAFLAEDSLAVDSVLQTLTMEQRVAQLLMVPIYARTDTSGWAEAERWTRDLGLGGVICMQGGPEHQRIRLNRLQALADVPLMVASDADWGLGMRLDSTRSFPRAMTSVPLGIQHWCGCLGRWLAKACVRRGSTSTSPQWWT